MRLYNLAFRALTKAKWLFDRAIDARISNVLGHDFEKSSGGRLTYRSWRSLPSDTTDRWSSKPSDTGRLTIVIVTFQQPEPLRCLLSSLRCQTVQNFDIIVLHDGPDDSTRRVVNEHKMLTDRPCCYVETDIRYNDYGHTLRDQGLQQATGEFVLITNGDNYYSPRFVEFAFEAVELGQLDMVLWNIVHSHHNITLDHASCRPFDCYPMYFRIDIGAFFVKTSLAQAVGFKSRAHAADADYLMQLLYLNPGPLRMGKVDKTLMVHN